MLEVNTAHFIYETIVVNLGHGTVKTSELREMCKII